MKYSTRTGFKQDYQLSIGGAAERINYYVSTSWSDNKGIVRGDDFSRLNLLAKMNVDITKWLNMSLDASYTRQDYSGAEANILTAYYLSPFGTPYRYGSDALEKYPVTQSDGLQNPLWQSDESIRQNTDVRDNYRLQASALVKCPWVEGLSARLNFSVTSTSKKTSDFRNEGYYIKEGPYDDSARYGADEMKNLLATATLQGIVNRKEPVLYMDYVNAGGVNTDEYWWDKFSAPGEWLAGREAVKVYDPVQACEILRDRFKGLVVYDPEVPATSNAASMIAGVEDLVAVRYDTTPGSFYTRLTAHGFEPKVWLVNQDGSSKFSSKTDVYDWAIRNYLSKGKCETEFAAYYIDQCWLKNPGASTKNHHQLCNHDFFVSHRSFFFDLSPWNDEVATDDPDGDVGGDYRTLKKILLEIYTRNGNGDVFCHIGGFPAWAYKYSDHSAVGGPHKPTETEWKFAEIIGEYHAYKDADAIAYGAMANASFWQHFPYPLPPCSYGYALCLDLGYGK